MSAVIRLKRHIDEEPYGAFVLNCKKRKVDGQSKEESSTILKFAGTVSQDADITAHISRMTKDDAKEIISKTHNPDLTERNRRESRAHAQSDRFKIVNCSRNLEGAGSSDTASGEDKTNVTIVDVEKENSVPASQEATQTAQTNGEDFVYDLYIAEVDSFQSPEIIIDDISVVEYGEYIYTTHRAENASSDDSEDSNEENNWRNDYPDEDEGHSSVDEDDMRQAVERCNLDGSGELSSDDEDVVEESSRNNGFVYSIDSEAIGFEDDLDYCDVARYGEAYARYKRRVLRHNDHDYTVSGGSGDDGVSENSDEYYYNEND